MKSNIISIIVVTLLVAGGVYWYFFTGTGNQPPLTTSSETANPAQMQFQALVAQLQSLSNFDTTIFSDPKFKALVDIGIPVTPESLGRVDPFATVPGVTGM